MAIPLAIVIIAAMTEITAGTGFIPGTTTGITTLPATVPISNQQSNKERTGRRKDLMRAAKF